MSELGGQGEDDGISNDVSGKRQSVAIQVNDTSSSPNDAWARQRKDDLSILNNKNARFLAVVLAASLGFGLVCTLVSFDFDFFKVISVSGPNRLR